MVALFNSLDVFGTTGLILCCGSVKVTFRCCCCCVGAAAAATIGRATPQLAACVDAGVGNIPGRLGSWGGSGGCGGGGGGTPIAPLLTF